ncbi:tRNA pseudouridine synthase A, partial [Salinimicrobium sp. CDJ15-91]
LQQKTEIIGAGRTDSGVHARQIFAHFDAEAELDEAFIFRMNSLLPKDISAKGLYKVTPEAHARFDAISRSYEYHIVTRKDVFSVDTAYHIHNELDLEKMKKAAEVLFGYTNFKCFSRSRTDVFTYNCTIKRAEWEQQKD